MAKLDDMTVSIKVTADTKEASRDIVKLIKKLKEVQSLSLWLAIKMRIAGIR